MIPVEILEQFGAKEIQLAKGDFLFKEGQYAKNYYQLSSGELKMNNYTEDGNEFIQAIFSKNESFGEPPLFGDFTYPANAEALTDCKLLSLKKEDLFELLKKNPEIHLEVLKSIAQRLYYKAKMAVEISNHQAGHRILTLIDFLKDREGGTFEKYTYEVELTRKQIGDLTGLRTETVIRAMKALEKESEIEIRERKVFR